MRKNLLILNFLILMWLAPAAQQSVVSQPYPVISGYVSFVHPIVSFDKTGSTFNFSHSYTIGFPMGINLLKNARFGYSFEITPFIRSVGDSSKVSNLLFHPGAMFRFKRGFTFISRLAFETGGRYGLTPVFNQVLARAKNVRYFVALSAPIRAGNDKPVSIGIAVQLGVAF